MRSNENIWRITSGLSGFIAVAMGAVAAHAIGDAPLSALAEKAALYQLIHSVVLLWLSSQQEKYFGLARAAFLLGIILFCGSLYLKALTGINELTALAPTGGISFMAGWLLIFLTACKK